MPQLPPLGNGRLEAGKRLAPITFGWEISHMTTLVTADEKGRISIRGSEPGQKYLVTQSGGEWRVMAYSEKGCASRNRKRWSGRKGKKGLFDHLKTMADKGLQIQPSELSQQPIPPCRF